MEQAYGERSLIQVIKTSKHGGGFAAVYYHGTASKTPGGKTEENGESMAMLMYDDKRWWILCDVTVRDRARSPSGNPCA